MAKLYWRIKKSGKWTWIPAEVTYYSKLDEDVIVLRYEEEEWWLVHGSHANIVAEKLWLQRPLRNTIAASRATWKEKDQETWRLKNEVHTVRPGFGLSFRCMARRGKTRSVGWTLDMPRVWVRGSIMRPIYRIWSCSRCYHKEISVAKKPRCTMCKRSEIALRMNVTGWLKWRRICNEIIHLKY